MDPSLARTVPWGGQGSPLGIRVRSIEAHHTLFRLAPDGQYLSGLHLGFILYANPGVHIYHSWDTAIFSDPKPIGELYKPDLGFLCAIELEDEHPGQIGLLDQYGNEIDGAEGAMTAQWLGLEWAMICYHLDPQGCEDAATFLNAPKGARTVAGRAIRPLPLQPGEVIEYEGEGER